jgi:hypothetical protein
LHATAAGTGIGRRRQTRHGLGIVRIYHPGKEIG